MLRTTSWKIAFALLALLILLMLVLDILLGIPNTKISSLVSVDLLIVPAIIFALASLLAFAVAVFWINGRSFREQMNYLIPRFASTLLVIVILFFAGARYYYATVKLGLDV